MGKKDHQKTAKEKAVSKELKDYAAVLVEVRAIKRYPVKEKIGKQ